MACGAGYSVAGVLFIRDTTLLFPVHIYPSATARGGNTMETGATDR